MTCSRGLTTAAEANEEKQVPAVGGHVAASEMAGPGLAANRGRSPVVVPREPRAVQTLRLSRRALCCDADAGTTGQVCGTESMRASLDVSLVVASGVHASAVSCRAVVGSGGRCELPFWPDDSSARERPPLGTANGRREAATPAHI